MDFNDTYLFFVVVDGSGFSFTEFDLFFPPLYKEWMNHSSTNAAWINKD